MQLSELPEAFTAYYHSFPVEEMNTLKLHHTRRVVENAQRIMQDAAFPSTLQPLGEMAAWLHDLGRFRQFQQYRTFSDRVSVNHALLSCGEILRLGWLDDWSAEDRNRILQAIEFHNLRDLPPNLSHNDLCLAHLVRDADKVDIFTVLDHAIETNYLPSHPEVYWGLPFTAPPSPKIINAISTGCSIDYADIKCFADFVFIQLSWCNGGLFFKESCKIVLERNETDLRRDYLISLLPDYREQIQFCCDTAKAALERKAYGA